MYRVIQRIRPVLFVRLTLWIRLALAACALACVPPAGSQIIIAAAASGRFAVEEIASGFQRSAGVETKAVYGASGKLSAQIRSGAPFDVFVSADLAYPDSLRAWGHASGKTETYAFGKLVLWSAGSAGSASSLNALDLEKGMAVLTDAAVTRIALADPKAAPYGREAVRAMRRAGVYDKVSGKLVYGESVSQVSQYVMTGNAEIGLTALSVVLSQSAQGKGKWKAVDAALYDPIAQGAVATQYGRDHHPSEAARFLEYLRSDSARAVLAKYGYGLP